MKIIMFLLLTSIAHAEVITTYYTRDDVFRVETAVCENSHTARKIIHEKTNELREIAILDGKRLVDEAGPANNPPLRKEVDRLFEIAKNCNKPSRSSSHAISQ